MELIAWWEEKDRWNCVVGRKVGGKELWWEEKGRWNCVVGRER